MRPDEIAVQPGYLSAEFIWQPPQSPAPHCHASTIVESGPNLVAAWFGGEREGAPDVGIWVSRRNAAGWSQPCEVATGRQPDGARLPCWNPVLFQPRNGALMLFYKVGPEPRSWWGMVLQSGDSGVTWGSPRRLPEGILGPIKNKPEQLKDGTLLCPSSREDHGWQVFFERTPDLGATWQRVGPVNSTHAFDAIQPSLLVHTNGAWQALCRTRNGRIAQVWSNDGGLTWSPMTATVLPNPNSGIDAVTLRDGRLLVVYNRARFHRSPLNVAISADGNRWEDVLVLENGPGEFSYPAVIQTADGRVHITYTYRRESIKHVTLDPARF